MTEIATPGCRVIPTFGGSLPRQPIRVLSVVFVIGIRLAGTANLAGLSFEVTTIG